eukprot:Opistho-2@17875
MAQHILHSGYHHEVLRKWQSPNTDLALERLMYPIFVSDVPDIKEQIGSLPGQYRFGVNHIRDVIGPLVAKGLKSVLVFGVPVNVAKDNNGTCADTDASPVVQAVKILRSEFPALVVACDVCLCAYTNHGHCGVFDESGQLDNEKSIKRLAAVALSYAKAGMYTQAPVVLLLL